MRRLLPTLVAALLLGACGRKAQPTETTSPSATPVAAPSGTSPAGTSASATVSAAPPAPTVCTAYRFNVVKPALTLLVPEPSDALVLVNETTREWLILRGPRGHATTADGALTLGGDVASGQLELRIAEGLPRAGKLDSGRAVTSLTYPLSGVGVAIDGGFRPRCLGGAEACPTLKVPARPVGFGAVSIAPEAVDRAGHCEIHGTLPTLVPSPGPRLAAAIEAAIGRACTAMGEGALEMSYVVTVLGGTQVNGGPAPSSTQLAGLTLSFRASSANGSSLSEEGHVLDLVSGELSDLKSLLRPTGAAIIARLLKSSYLPNPLGALRPDERVPASALETAGFSMGPSTFDLVVPTSPWGILLPNRRVAIGMRSELSGAFVLSPMTERITRPLNVDL